MARVGIGILLVVAIQTSADATSPSVSASSGSTWAAHPTDPTLIVGNDACVKCHASEVRVWRQTPHFKTFEELHRRPEAKQIAKRLGLRSIKNEGRCIGCHYTTQQSPGSAHAAQAIAGVSCESCHGAARRWMDLHHDYGGETITRLTESPQHRQQRIASSVAAGMRNPHNVYAVAQSCLRCHTTADEELVNVGGHSTGSQDFEFVSWSQGMIRHNFVRSDGKTNDASDPARLRVMFVSGIIAELEASLRATAIATQKATFGVTAAKRAHRASKRVASIAAKIDDVHLDQIVEIAGGVKLKLNNGGQLSSAADRIAQLGYQFAARNNGESLAVLDPFIPAADRWK